MPTDPISLDFGSNANGGQVALASNHLAPSAEQLQAKFIRLRNEWKVQRRHQSSTMKIATLPSYQRIIGMGPAAVPFLSRIQRQPIHDIES
jgi:hypothetical protein